MADLIPLQSSNTWIFVLHKQINLTTNCGEEKEKMVYHAINETSIIYVNKTFTNRIFDKQISVTRQMVLQQEISLQPINFLKLTTSLPKEQANFQQR